MGKLTSSDMEVRGAADLSSVDVVLRETIEKLKAAAPKRLDELRNECDISLRRLDGQVDGCVSADDFYVVLKLACEATGCPKVVSIALDAIQKLMASSFLTGRGADPFKEPQAGQMPRSLIDSVIESICGCAEPNDETVQVQMIRCLLTAVTSQTCGVHGRTLMLAVRTCFQIHRDSKNSNNQRTAQSSLTQMLNVVTQRMELSSADMSRRSVSFEELGELKRSVSLLVAVKPSADLTMLPPTQLLNEWMGSYVTRLVDKVVLDRGGASEGLPPAGKLGWCIVCRESAPHYCMETRDPICGRPCKIRNLERLALLETHFGMQKGDAECEAIGEPVVLGDGDVDTASAEAVALERVESAALLIDRSLSDVSVGEKALNPHHRDALMVFSSLCKLSMKDFPTGTVDARIVRSKRLSLELVLGMLHNCGPVFRSSDPFISALKSLLCVSLIKNSVSSIPKVFSLSLQIFVMLITNFKDHLKIEIGVFIEQIFLRILGSGNSTYQHKHRVLQVFYKLCTDAATALELFLNFDCDVDEKNIFERMIDCLSKIAQGKYTAIEHANLIQPQQEQELKILSLNALVKLMGSIVDWARRMTEDQRTAVDEEYGVGAQARFSRSMTDVDSDAEDDAKSESTLATSASISTAPSVPSSLIEQKQRKLDLQVGVTRFNIKPKRGIEYLKANGFIGDDAESLAAFFQNSDLGLDKTQVGDYLGEDKPFNKAVLYALVDNQSFEGQGIDVSLRAFLSNFRLPGEAQKIDRMMEKFAEKYCQDNPGKFENADCAFVLSFSLIMLQTDLHNVGIKKEHKMTKDGFVRNNRGINNGKDLEREFLETLFDNIQKSPFSLKEDEDAKTRLESQSAQGATQKFELFVRETESIVKKSQDLMLRRSSRTRGASNSYIAAHNVDHVRPLFEVACWPMLATLAVLLETQDQTNSVELCIEGFKHCIRIAARFDMDTERDAFVSSLAKFTYLTTLKEMKQKNLECIKALLAIGLSEGSNLGPAWQFVLHCISQLERLQLLQIKARQDHQFFQGDDDITSPGASANWRRSYGTGVSALITIGSDDHQVEQLNSESVMSQIDVAQIDLLFSRSANLSSGAIVHFVQQLARVSKEELSLPDQPRIFSLQKLVEVADFNMGRMRIVWSRVWRAVSAHFVEVASHPNTRICMYAIDSLRQLAMKFLEKDELSNYHFQVEFLRPFEVVMIDTPGVRREVKELIVSIISNMVQARIKHIKSGWKVVFNILIAASQETSAPDDEVAKVAFAVLKQVVEGHYPLFLENFADGVRTLLAFGQCKASLDMSLKAITYLLQSASYLAATDRPELPLPLPNAAASAPPTAATTQKDVMDHSKRAIVASSASASAASVGLVQVPLTVPPGSELPAPVAGSSPIAVAYWLPILRSLSVLVGDPRRDVRTAALNGVFDCLRDHGCAAFDRDTWLLVFRGVIFPLFEDIHRQLQQHDQKEGGGEGTEGFSLAAKMGPPTCLAALTSLVRLFDVNLEVLAFLLGDLLKLLTSCIQHETEAVARIGVEGLKQLLLLTGRSLSPKAWEDVARTIFLLFSESMPSKLMVRDVSACVELPFRRDVVVMQCVVQLLLIDMLQETMGQHLQHIPPVAVMSLLDSLRCSFEFAHKFNQQIGLRQALKRLGFMSEMKQLPGLLKQELEALSCLLKTLFQVPSDDRMCAGGCSEKAVHQLLAISEGVLCNYVLKEQRLQEHLESPGTPDASLGDMPADMLPSERDAILAEMEREVTRLMPIICEIVLPGIRHLDALQSQRFFPMLCELTVVNSCDVRLMLRDMFMDQAKELDA